MCVCMCMLNLVKKLAQDQGRLGSSEPSTALCSQHTGEAGDEADSDNTGDVIMTEMTAATVLMVTTVTVRMVRMVLTVTGAKSLLSTYREPSPLRSASIYFTNSFHPHNLLVRKGL